MSDAYVHDIENYPNVFLFGAIHALTETPYIFEISHRRDDRQAFYLFTEYLREHRAEEIGYNNLGYDYPVQHSILNNIMYITNADIYKKGDSIINAGDENRFAHMVWEKDWIVPQLDLYKIHHFDNQAKRTSLKTLEFNMRMENIEDLPFTPGTYLTDSQIDTLRQYLIHDLKATLMFYKHSKKLIDFRRELSAKYGRNFMNHNDTKIGKDYFIMELEKSGIQCFEPGSRKPRQTHRPSIALNSVIFPYVRFEQPEFNRVLNWLRQQVITETKGVFTDLSADINGFSFDFGTGGIHGSIESQTIRSTENYVIIDLDVASFYPNLAISNELYPAHLGKQFCTIYKNVYDMRSSYPKGTPENAMLKLALNGVYGDSNNVYSPFYDPAYTMAITINGQLLLCMLAEELLKIPGLSMIQANTDGLTVYAPRVFTGQVEQVRHAWEKLTRLQLEEAIYDVMFIRDVNNYIAVYEGGKKVKRKGAYCHSVDLGWHQNHSMQVVAKAAEAALVHNKDIHDFITSHEDIHDFMLVTKVPRNSKLLWGDKQVQNITRYYVSTDGAPLTKVMPPLAKSLKLNPDAPERRMSVCKGWLTTECNDMKRFNRATLNYDFYIKEAEKLVAPLR
nr:MAG: DNA polymerase family B [Bacteriophage sp.]UWI24586.1 MAG: DNA polymerase family B [Bacteriophage sp.]